MFFSKTHYLHSMYLQGILLSKEAELQKCQARVSELEGELRNIEHHSSKNTFIKMKKVCNYVLISHYVLLSPLSYLFWMSMFHKLIPNMLAENKLLC